MVGVMNWLKGYLRIRVSGSAVERFLNLCGYKNILLWDIIKCDDCYEMYLSIKAFRLLRSIVRKTKIKVVILERFGLPFFVSKLKRRKIFVLGFILAIFIWYVSGFHIWQIDIQGNYRITTEQLEDYLMKKNITIGVKKDKINIEELEKDLRITFPLISWTSGKIDGTTFFLEIKETEGAMVLEQPDNNVAYDIISDSEGEIYSIIVRKGIPKVKQGDMVNKDTVLVEGNVPVFNDDGTIREYIKVKSDADIYIKHSVSHEEKLPLKYIKKKYTGRIKKVPYMYLGENEISPRMSSGYLVSDTLIKESTPKLLKDLKIPVKWGSYTYREYMNVETLYTKEEAENILVEQNEKFIESLIEKGVQIIEKDVKIIMMENEWVLKNDMIITELVTRLENSQNMNGIITMENE